MDALPLTPVTSPQTVFAADVPSPAASGDSAVRGADFANLLEHLMAPAGRQDLAAATAPAAPALQSLTLSPTFEVITANEPMPDNDSLLAFVRSQGLGEVMISSLFVAPLDSAGKSSSPPVDPAGAGLPTSVMLAAVGLPVTALAADAAALREAGDQRLSGVLTGQVGVPVTRQAGVPVTGQVLGAVTAAANLAAPAVNAVRVSALQTDATSQPVALQASGLSAPDPAAARPMVEWAASRGLAEPAGASSVAALTAARASAQVAGVAGAASAQDAQAVEADATELQAMRDALRVQLQPQEQLTRRLAALAASGQQAMWGQLADPAGQDSLMILQLPGVPAELESAAAGEPVTIGEEGASSGSGHGLGQLQESRQGGAASAAAAGQAPSTADERAQQYEQLAQRLGQALGQRLQAQIERGQWKVQMQVDPASLGRIDMELDMRAGSLEAVFRSDNQMTRDLIAQGLPRLRETLTQSGTTVANVWVQGDSSRQSGGNPTPGRWVPAGRESASSDDEQVVSEQVPRAPRAGSSAWDVLA